MKGALNGRMWARSCVKLLGVSVIFGIADEIKFLSWRKSPTRLRFNSVGRLGMLLGTFGDGVSKNKILLKIGGQNGLHSWI